MTGHSKGNTQLVVYIFNRLTEKFLFFFRRGSWRPIGHMRPSSPLLDSVRDLFEGQDQLARDFTKAFQYPKDSKELVPNFFDITFIVGQGKVKTKLKGVRALMGVRSR